MPVKMKNPQYRSLRMSVRTALAALMASVTTACIFVDGIVVNADPEIPFPGTTMNDESKDSEEPCETTQAGEVPVDREPGGEESSCSSGSGATGDLEPPHRPTTGEVPVDTTGPGADTGGASSGEPLPVESTGEAPPPPPCGNGVLDVGEVCDDGVNDGAYGGCHSDCSGLAPFCGDGEVNDVVETCDDGNDDDADGCTNSCAQVVCGDGLVQGSEACDGSAVFTETCESLGFAGGLLMCAESGCVFDTSLCNDCGNGVIDGAELCDGADLGGATCASLGLFGTELGCNDSCDGFDASACSTMSSDGGCCVVGEVGSCSTLTVEACVCELSPDCCELEWSADCVSSAILDCFAQC